MKLSACAIAKNEEKNIAKSINSYKEYVDEIIVVDTGSSDDTVKVAKEAGAKVLHFDWINDFSAAKNFALDNATGDWVIFLDADEWFDGDCAKEIRKAITETEKQGYYAIACKLVNLAEENEILETSCTSRIFKNDPKIRFCRAIHETLFNLTTNIALESFYRDYLVIMHSGYMHSILPKKAERNKILLEKNYAKGTFSGIDYFYAMRENLRSNPLISSHFYKMISMIDDYDEQIKSYNIGSNIYESKIKLVTSLTSEYSVEDAIPVLNEAKENYPDNPVFYFYEYVLYANIDYMRAIEALKRALVLDKEYEKNNPSKSNSFYVRRTDVYCALGRNSLLFNDRLSALNNFTEAVKCDSKNYEAFKGLLYIMGSEKPDDIVIFINSIYDVKNKEVLRFLVEALRLTKYHDVFLYYFVKWHNLFNEVDHSFFTSRMITKNYAEIANTYLKVYNDSKDLKALTYVTAALICGELEDEFLRISHMLPPTFTTVLSAYFNNEDITSVNEQDIACFGNVFTEIAYLADENVIRRFVEVYKTARERILKKVISLYYTNYDFDKAETWCNLALESDVDSDLKAYCYFILTYVHYYSGNFDMLTEDLENVITNGYLDQNIVVLCDILEADDGKLAEYKELTKLFLDADAKLKLNNFNDCKSVIKESVGDFEKDIANKKIHIVKDDLSVFYRFAEKAYALKRYNFAEKYYRLVAKYGDKSEAYYRLGIIYNLLKNPDLSFYCYEKSFENDIALAAKILPKTNNNSSYVYGKRIEERVDICPICHEKGKAWATYSNLESANLSYNESLIVKYCKCEKCNHVFAQNFMTKPVYPEKETDNLITDEEVKSAYVFFNKLSKDVKSILCVSDYESAFSKVAKSLSYSVTQRTFDELLRDKKKYDMIHIGNLLERSERVTDIIENAEKSLLENGMIVFELYDCESVFSKLKDVPLWVKSGTKNVFSRKSVRELCNKFALIVEKEEEDLHCIGKMTIVARKK